jgi:lipopolysaccharide export system permease protein
MTTLDRYLLREWTKVFLLTALGFPLVVILFDLTDRLDTYLARGLDKGTVGLSYLFSLPETVFLVLPAAVLFATVFTVGSASRHSELTAAKAGGISFHRLVLPMFLAAAVAFLGGVALAEIAPVATTRRLELLGDKQVRGSASRFNFVYRADQGWIYAIRSLQISTNLMQDVILEREGLGPEYPTIVVAAAEARYDTTGHHWTLTKGAVRYLLGDARELAFNFDSLRQRSLSERPADLLAEPKAPEEMRYAELGRYIDALARSGTDHKKLRVKQALKIAVPFTCVIIALFGAPLAVSNPRAGSAFGIAVSLGTTVVFLVSVQLSQAVGAGGLLPPVLAAWLPNIVFGGTAVWLLRKVRT